MLLNTRLTKRRDVHPSIKNAARRCFIWKNAIFSINKFLKNLEAANIYCIFVLPTKETIFFDLYKTNTY